MLMAMRAHPPTVVQLLLAAILALSSSATFAQQGVRETLFGEADEALAAAKAARAALLAPKSYGLASEHYRRAEDLLKRGKNLDRIQDQLAGAVEDFKKAVTVAKVADVSMGSALQSRADAENADAASYATELWQEAEEYFRKGGVRLEEGSLKSAQRYADKAQVSYREAELAAIKVNYLSETRELLARAEELKAKRYAPRTLGNARRLYAEAEKQLNENRYDTDQPRSLAQSAKHEAKLAIYLSELLKLVSKDKVAMEDVVLDWQTPLKSIGAALDMPIYFDDGYQTATSSITARIETMYATGRETSQQLADNNVTIGDLRDRVAELEAKLGGASEERLALNLQLERQTAIRAKFREVEQLFNREEALVLRSGNDVILRLVGLTFDSGRAVIESERLGLLTKVQQAIEIFPSSTLLIEGHTDSFGSDEDNLALSQRRAEATRRYLLAAMPLVPEQVAASGYGESRPVANNEIPEGRMKNRRIDIVIKPIF